ncbi:hypothetical protein ON010_g19173 [Phytophthora cinnamomi]|nr:hypothetical protein ON010_g19173 [Phytophthora cinnamomi]
MTADAPPGPDSTIQYWNQWGGGPATPTTPLQGDHWGHHLSTTPLGPNSETVYGYGYQEPKYATQGPTLGGAGVPATPATTTATMTPQTTRVRTAIAVHPNPGYGGPLMPPQVHPTPVVAPTPPV